MQRIPEFSVPPYNGPNPYDRPEMHSLCSGQPLHFTNYTKSPDDRTCRIELPPQLHNPGTAEEYLDTGWVVKWLLPSKPGASLFDYSTPEKRRDALVREASFMLYEIERYDLPVQMDVVQIEIDHTSQTVTLSSDDYYRISEHHDYYLPSVDPSREYAIVTQKMPEGSADQNHYGQEEVYQMISDVTRHLANTHYEMSREGELEILQRGVDPLINITSVKERYAMNQEWDGGKVEQHLRQVYDQAGTQQEKAMVAELIAVAQAWPTFHEEILYPGSPLHELLTYIDFTLYRWTHGDPKLANIYRGTYGSFFYLDPVGDIARPGYRRLLYEQEGLADVAMFAADLMAHVYTPHDFQEGPGLQDLPSTILDRYLHRLSVDHSIPPIMSNEVMSIQYLYNQELKFCYYAAARSRMLATAALLGDNNPAMIEPYLRVCDYFMTKTRQLLATPDAFTQASHERYLKILGMRCPIPAPMIPDTYVIMADRFSRIP